LLHLNEFAFGEDLMSAGDEEGKIQMGLELKFKLFEETRDKVERRMTSEIKRIEEAWQDIAEHEKHIKDQSTEKLICLVFCVVF
jgi:RNAse (barnase) inhibitor barstar